MPAITLAHLGDVADVGHLVGYNSPSQFNREYRRCLPPHPAKDPGGLLGVAQPPGLLVTAGPGPGHDLEVPV
jgi:hypothetical protein